MKIDRRKFLKMAGLAGVGVGLSATDMLKVKTADASTMSHSGSSASERLAMVIDIGKFRSMEDYSRVINACHSIHNVPDIGNPKDEVKWIWTDKFEHTFPDQMNEYLPGGLLEKPFLMLCNHCEKPP